MVSPPCASVVDSALRDVVRAVSLLRAVTPSNAHLERARLTDDFRGGRERLPAWAYDPPDDAARTHARRKLDGVVAALRAWEGPAAELYRARAEELSLEIDTALAVGTPRFAHLARARFSRGPALARAESLTARWLEEKPAAPAADTVLDSDDRHPASLLSRMRAEVARRRLPFDVRTNPTMSALAAISGDTLWIAERRRVSREDVERTVVHEIQAHALPRARARSMPFGLFAVGTAGGTDDQEGYALWLEEKRGMSGPSRRKELAARHRAVTLMRDGADFVAVVRSLRSHGVELDAALRVAERVFRGSSGSSPGLGREHVYVESFLRVRDHLAACPGDERVLSAGQVAVVAVDALRAFVGPSA